MTKYFDPGIKLTGIVNRSDEDLKKAFLYAFAEDNGITVRHRPDVPPSFLIELGEKLIEIGKRLQQ